MCSLTALQRFATDFQRRLRVPFELVGQVARLVELVPCRTAPTSPGIGETLPCRLSGPGGEQKCNPGSHQRPEHEPRRDG